MEANFSITVIGGDDPQDGFERSKSISGNLSDVYGPHCNINTDCDGPKCYILVTSLRDLWLLTDGGRNTSIATYPLIPLLVCLLPFSYRECALLTKKI